MRVIDALRKASDEELFKFCICKSPGGYGWPCDKYCTTGKDCKRCKEIFLMSEYDIYKDVFKIDNDRYKKIISKITAQKSKEDQYG